MTIHKGDHQNNYMPSALKTFALIGSLLISLAAVPAFAKELLVTHGDRVIVYTGPGKSFRPLTILSSGAEVQVAPALVKSRRGGEFYKVLVQLSNKKKAVGYIALEAGVRKKSNAESADDIEKFIPVPLAQKAIQVSYSHLKTGRSLITGGIVSYVAPDFYLKAFGGGFRTETGASPLVGVEFGNDAILYRSISGFLSMGGGVFITPKENALFPGNKKDLSNFIVQAAGGVRFNFHEVAAISLGGTQAALFSHNNSDVTWGLIGTLEWGL